MSGRTWQMIAAFISVGVMVVVLFKYGVVNDPPTTKSSGQPHVGAQHHGDETTSMGGQLARRQVFANAKVGDWIAYRVLNRSTLLPQDIEGVVVARVTAASDTTVTVSYDGNVPDLRKSHWETEYPRAGLTFDKLTGNDISEWTIFDLVTTDDVAHDIGGRSFTCEKLSWSANDPMFPTKRVQAELWISADVPVGGLVEQRDVQDLGETHIEQLKELIGFGTADATSWGTRPPQP